MAVLVTGAFRKEIASGVAVTIPATTTGATKVLVNAQVGGRGIRELGKARQKPKDPPQSPGKFIIRNRRRVQNHKAWSTH